MRSIIFKTALAIWFILWVPFLFIALPSKWLTGKVLWVDARGVLWVARIFAGIKFKIHDNPYGKSWKPSKNQPIIAAKHMSVLEVAMLYTTIPNRFFILKKGLMFIPFYGWAFARVGMVPIDRSAGSNNMRKLAATVSAKINTGMTLIIYPEGTRAYPGKPMPLKRGLLFLAETLKLPIQPVGTDAGLYWPRRGSMKPGTANMYFEKILPHDATLSEIFDAINKRSA